MILAVTGPRPQSLGITSPCELSRAIQQALEAELLRLKPARAISGMALGVDQWFAWLCVRHGVPFTAAVPFEGQASEWPKQQRVNWCKLRSLAAEVVVTGGDGYGAWKFQHRNEWMVDRCDVLLAVIWPGYRGGTANCVEYAEKVGRRVVRLNPRET